MKYVHEAQVLGKDHNDFLLMCMVLVRGITGSRAAGALHRSVCERVPHSALTLGIWSQILPMAKGEVILFRHPADETLTLRIIDPTLTDKLTSCFFFIFSIHFLFIHHQNSFHHFRIK